MDYIVKARSQDKRILIKTSFDVNHPLFDVPAKNPPPWWINLKNDPEFKILIISGNAISTVTKITARSKNF
jgi:hypothetical protein